MLHLLFKESKFSNRSLELVSNGNGNGWFLLLQQLIFVWYANTRKAFPGYGKKSVGKKSRKNHFWNSFWNCTFDICGHWFSLSMLHFLTMKPLFSSRKALLGTMRKGGQLCNKM